jgi:hypothetical protein
VGEWLWTRCVLHPGDKTGMIISASYKTDIPTFYGDWFMSRLHQGHCKIVNPYNRRISRFDLGQTAVDGIVFWTKNIGPFLRFLPEIKARGYPLSYDRKLWMKA